MRGIRGQRGGRPPGARRVGGATVLVLAVSLAAAGCSSGASGRTSTADAAAGPGAGAAAPQQPGARAGTAGPGAGATPSAVRAKAARIVRTATLTVRTGDVAGALARARAAATDAGGYAADETTDRDPDGRDRSKLVLRVPPDHYDALLKRLSGLGTVLAREVAAKDVTDQVVDTDSRVKSQRASVERIRALMDRASSISDITALEAELSSREANLESLEAQLASLKDSTGAATVTLLLRQPGATEDPSPDRGTSFGDALADAWHAFTGAARWVLVALAAVLPFALAGGGLYALWRAVRGRLPGGARRRARGKRGGAANGPGTPGATGTPAEHRTADQPMTPHEAPAPGEPQGDRSPR
ncbi:hypothetical protein ADL22_10165 [Streptomyces sp. NRRL F-4489]|uniref:DUF4349 domain-containing protein n=1 Tax=Streptomyces sp. NRRL F-4489 TaxID=1609095 RepID=UPI000747C059|nr:DUF4349 domain-containing protein [Streptomyces sp. NRRL F-4489]KUL47421.1 hypothetical protein ADL22_10165 [Streptomyces sp. NRRL F-4489]